MPRQNIHLLEDICSVITGSRDPRKTLDTIVELVAERFSIDGPRNPNKILTLFGLTSGASRPKFPLN